jgi:hypothetical protein
MSSRDWNLGGGSPKTERQLFVEAQGSSKGQAFSAIACTLQSAPEVLALFTPWHVPGQKSLYRNLNALRSVNLDSGIGKAAFACSPRDL